MRKKSNYYYPVIATQIATIAYFVLLLLSLTSCSKDDTTIDNPIVEEEIIVDPVMPKLTLLSGEKNTYLGVVGSPTQGSLQHQIKAEAPDGFVSLEIFKVLDDVANSYVLLDTKHPNYTAGSNTFTYTLNYILNDVDEPGHGLQFKAVVTDANNNTATLDFAKVDLRLPMLKKTVTLKTKWDTVGDITIPYYLSISGINVKAVNHDVAVNVNNDQNIAFAFSRNDESGFYIGSLSAVEPVLSNGMQQKSTTKFKQVNGLDVTPIFTLWNEYDTHNIEYLYSNGTFNSYEQKAGFVLTVGRSFYFLTDDNRVGILQTKSFSIVEDDATVELDMYIQQPL